MTFLNLSGGWNLFARHIPHLKSLFQNEALRSFFGNDKIPRGFIEQPRPTIDNMIGSDRTKIDGGSTAKWLHYVATRCQRNFSKGIAFADSIYAFGTYGTYISRAFSELIFSSERFRFEWVNH